MSQMADNAAVAPGSAGTAEDRPRTITTRISGADLAFRTVVRLAGLLVLGITGLIAAFLIDRASSTLHAVGWHFLTNFQWILTNHDLGVGAILPDTILIALIALIFAVPVALAVAVFISEYAPYRLKRALIALIDLMAAIPSILYAVWGFFWLMPRFTGVERWISDHLGFIPFLKVPGTFEPGNFEDSTLLVGLVVSLMLIPIIASISREVFSQAPQGEREAAYALGSTRWGMVRTVVLPYGRGGVIGAVMLGFGRAMGETIVVALIVSQVFTIVTHPLQSGGNSIAALIAQDAEESTPAMISALIAAGLVLFVVTLIVNAIAATIVARSRSGLQTAD
jgi:phosphate transport system permease protein